MYQEYFKEDHQSSGPPSASSWKGVKPDIEHWEDAEIFPVELYAKPQRRA